MQKKICGYIIVFIETREGTYTKKEFTLQGRVAAKKQINSSIELETNEINSGIVEQCLRRTNRGNSPKSEKKQIPYRKRNYS